MNKLLRIIFLFTFSLSIIHAQVYYEDITEYSLQDIPESYLDKISNFDGKDGLKATICLVIIISMVNFAL